MVDYWMPGCPSDPGVMHGPLTPIAVVLHRTYGQWPGDYSVGKQGIFHWLIGKDDGQWVQFAPANIVQYHCNGANFKAVGIEMTGVNEDALTHWQSARLGDILNYLNTQLGISLSYLDPFAQPPAVVHVNDGNYRGAISHYSVMTDDGSPQHTDLITVTDYQKAVGQTPPPIPDPAKDLLAMGKIVLVKEKETGAIYNFDGQHMLRIGDPDLIQQLISTGHIKDNTTVDLLAQQIAKWPKTV